MEFKGSVLERISVSFSIYLLLSFSMVLLVAAEEKPFAGSITVRDVNDPWNTEIILDKYSEDALTVVKVNIEECQTEITCGEGSCDIPYTEITGDEELPEDEDGEEKSLVSICDYLNSDGEHVKLAVDPQRWTNVAVKYVSDTEFEYYFLDQEDYSITQSTIQGDVRVYRIQHSERLKETMDDVTSVGEILCSADLLGEAEIECNEQTMEIYAIVATYWYFITHFWEFIMASLQPYISLCDLLDFGFDTLKSKFGDLLSIFGDSENEYLNKLAQYGNLIAGLVQDAYELYEKYYAYVLAALSCKEAYEYIKGLFDSIMDLIDKIESYLEFLENPLPECLSSLMERLQALQERLMGLIPDFIPEMDDFLDILDGLFPDCIQDFLDMLSDFKDLLNRFLALLPSYCAKVQTMKEHYEGEGDGEMANKYAALYVPCEGLWSALSLDDGILSQCTDIEGLGLSEFLPENCQELYNLDLGLSLGLEIDLPQECIDLESILEMLLACDEDFGAYKDKYSDFDEGEGVSC